MRKKFYITTAIPYPNAKPHIGFGLEIVQTDAIARARRLLGDDVYFLTGTDEHGTKVYEAAKKAGIDPQEFVKKNTKEFVKLKEILNISNDDFIKTTDKKRHWPAVEKIWKLCQRRGDIYKKTYTALYCVGCEEFKTKSDLEKGKCPEHPERSLEKISEENYFFKLSKYQDEIQKKIESCELKVIPQTRKNEVLGFIRGGLEDFSISRPKEKLPWGIRVPGDESQVIYVWFDALTNYLSAIGFGTDEKKFKKWWPADLHVIGKGVLRFHAIYWPSMLISAGLPLPKSILVHGYVTVNGQKISKSLGNVVEPQIQVKKFSRDALRFYLLKEIPTFSDGDFSEKKFLEIYNGELANNLGNLVSRVAKLAENLNFEAVKTKGSESKKELEDLLENLELSQALDHLNKKISSLNKELDLQKPWEFRGIDRQIKLENIINQIRGITFKLGLFLPETAEKIQKQFAGPKIKSAPPLFPRK